jgi:dephospho-CoA kinase
MSVFGITGSFGSGKSTVSGIFSSLGARVIDADKIVHEIIKQDRSVYREIVSLFGEAVVDKKTKQISRKALGKIVFNNKRLLRKLCDIIHPRVIREIKGKITKNKKSKNSVIIIDAPLLIEAGLISLVDKLIVVKTKREFQIERIHRRTGLSESEILRRINSQASLKEKIKHADYVINNSFSLDTTKRQVRDIWNKEIIKKIGRYK